MMRCSSGVNVTVNPGAPIGASGESQIFVNEGQSLRVIIDCIGYGTAYTSDQGKVMILLAFTPNP